MTLKKKIILSFSLSFSIILILGIFVYLSFISIKKETKFLELSDTIRSKSLQLRRHEKNFLLYQDFEEAGKALVYISEIKELIKQNSLNDKTIPILSQLNYKLDEYEDRFGKIMQATTFLKGSLERVKGQNPQYSYIFAFISSAFLDHPLETAELLKRFPGTEQDRRIKVLRNIKLDTSSLRKIGEEALTISKELGKSARERTENIIRALGITTCILLPLSFLTGFIGLFVVTHGVVMRLRGFMRTVEKIGKGDFSAFPILSKQRDEVNTLMTLFNNMVLDLRDRETELIEKEKELYRHKRLAAVGTLASGIAHELNNPINNIYLAAQILSKEIKDAHPEIIKDTVRDISSQSLRVKGLVADLLDFTKERELECRDVSLNRIIEQAFQELSKSSDLSRINFLLSSDKPEVIISADPARLERVFLNLFKNAVDTMKDGGALNVRIISGDDTVSVEVSDTGKGIPREIHERIFEPFFTTKEEGTGLGLSMVYNIVKKHGGNISVESEEGKGSTFKITLHRRVTS